MRPQPTKTPRSEAYLAWLREQPCCVTGTEGTTVQACHVRLGNGGGVGLKPSDFRALPLSAWMHHDQHQVGEITFWSRAGKDPDVEIISHLVRYIGEPKEVIRALEAYLTAKESPDG